MSQPLARYLWTLLGLSVLLVLAASWAFARWYVKPRRRLPEVDPSDVSLPFESVRFPSQGLLLEGWYVPAAPSPLRRPAVVVLHGWSANATQMLPLAAVLQRRGFGVLLFHARGHGTSPRDGPVTIVSFAEDLRAALRFLELRYDVDASRLAIVGHSIGGAAAILATAGLDESSELTGIRVRAVVSASAFAHPREVTRRVLRTLSLPGWPFLGLVCLLLEGWLGSSMDDVAPERRVGRIAAALLLLHGQEDSFVPPADCELLWSRANRDLVERSIVPGRRHGDLLIDPEVCAKVADFLCDRLDFRPMGSGDGGRTAAGVG